MKLLFDENLSRKLAYTLARIYSESEHVAECGLERAGDSAVWDHAREHGFVIVTKDTDFHQRSFLYGHPPKVIWIRLGNCSTSNVETLLRVRAADVKAFGKDRGSALLVLP